MLSRRLLLALTVTSALFASAFTRVLPAQAQKQTPEFSQPVKIGVVAPLTGNSASYGADIKIAAEIWQQHVNAQGGILGHQVQLVLVDDRGDPKEAVSAANLIVGSGAFAVLGHGLSGTTLPAKNVYAENKILLLANANADGITDPASPYILRVLPRNRDYAKPVAKEIIRQADKDSGPIYMVDDNTDYGKGLTDEVYRLLLDDLGLPVDLRKRVVRQSVTNGENDYIAETTRLRAANSQIVVLAMPETTAGLIVRQAANQKYFPTFIGHSRLTFQGFGNTVIAFSAQATVIGVPGSDNLAVNEHQTALYAAFKKHQHELGATELGVYAGLDLLRQAAVRTNSFDPIKISKALHTTSYQSVTGEMHFDANGNLVEPPLSTYYWQNKDGAAVLRQTTPSP